MEVNSGIQGEDRSGRHMADFTSACPATEGPYGKENTPKNTGTIFWSNNSLLNLSSQTAFL